MTQLDELCQRLETADSRAIAAEIEAAGEPQQVAKRYADLTGHLYNGRKDVTRMLMMAGAGIDFCLAASSAAASAEAANKLKASAKIMAYNASANAWPAWEDEGIVITRSDSLVALDLAWLNLRLARELDRGDDVLGNAHWLIGAQQFALGERDNARDQFATAVAHFVQAEQEDFRQMAIGYVAIAESSQPELNAAIAALQELGTDDATFFAEQLQSVAKYFNA